MIPLPEGFIEMIGNLLGDESTALIESLDQTPVTSVRLNRRKPVTIFPEGEKVKWCESGLYLPERPEFILDPLIHAGAYYVQDASSMIYETVASIISSQLLKDNPDTRLKVLDLCAAPGGKTTAMINALPDGTHMVANEYSSKRVGVLRENLIKWGYKNVTVTNKDSAYYSDQADTFDIVAVDAPCSGEGMMRKDNEARRQWSQELVDRCSVLQREIVANAIKCLKPGGFLIYSTCTFNRYENEDNAKYISDELGLEPVDLKLPEDWDIPRGIGSHLPVYRFMPHKTKGEGLFLAVFRKPGEWEPSVKRNNCNDQLENLSDPSYPLVDVDKATALAYLRRESIHLPDDSPIGFVTISYMGLPLGPAKNIGSRANNLYPKNWRILKR